MPGVGARIGGGALRLLLLLAVFGAVASPAALARESVSIDVLSNRAELISGGDALVAVNLPRRADASRVRVEVDGRDVSGAFALRPNGKFEGLAEGSESGPQHRHRQAPERRRRAHRDRQPSARRSGHLRSPDPALEMLRGRGRRPVQSTGQVRVLLHALERGRASSPTTRRARPRVWPRPPPTRARRSRSSCVRRPARSIATSTGSPFSTNRASRSRPGLRSRASTASSWSSTARAATPPTSRRRRPTCSTRRRSAVASRPCPTRSTTRATTATSPRRPRR